VYADYFLQKCSQNNDLVVQNLQPLMWVTDDSVDEAWLLLTFLIVYTPVSGGRYLMKKLILGLAAFAVSGLAMAGPSWTYGEVGYVRADSGDDNTDAFQLKGSFGFADKFHVQAKYYDGENGDIGNNGEDFDGYEIRLGINPAVTDNTDFVFQVGYMDMSQERGSNAIAGSLKDVDSDGYILTVGLRSMLTDQLEISGYVDSIAGEADEYDKNSLGEEYHIQKNKLETSLAKANAHV
jgi:hypothetical protein